MRNTIVPPENVIAKEIPNYPGYWATDDGRIWSGKTNRYRALSTNANGYFVVTFSGGVSEKVHRLVALAWHGPSDLPMVRHLNGDQKDNRPANLAYGTNSENLADEARLGRLASGTLCHRSTVTLEQARLLVELRGAGVSVKAAARKLRIAESTVRSLLNGHTWFRLRRCPFTPPQRLLDRWRSV